MSIAEPLRALAVPLDRLEPLPGNPRRGDVDGLVRSYRMFGQRKPIVARRTGGTDDEPTGVVIAGNHQLAAAQRLGWSEIAVVWTVDDEKTAKAFALADNRTADLGGYDDADLASMLGDVASHAELLEATSFTEADLDDLLALLRPYDPEAEWVAMPEHEQDELSGHKVTVRFATVENRDAFFSMLGVRPAASLWWPTGDGHKGRDASKAVVIADLPS